MTIKHPMKQVVFFAVGFETTIPSIAWVVKEARKRGIDNLSFLTCLRLVPPALKAILTSGDVCIDGFISRGQVSVILWSKPYAFVAEEFGMPGAITGFEPADLLLGIISVLHQVEQGAAIVDIAYPRAVSREGNPRARKLMEKVFNVSDGEWRGLGVIPMSGFR